MINSKKIIKVLGNKIPDIPDITDPKIIIFSVACYLCGWIDATRYLGV